MAQSDTPILDYRPGRGVLVDGDVIPPFAPPVTSVFTRLGDIVALAGDYAAFYAPLGSGVPGNPSGAMQYNNAGVFAANPSLTSDGVASYLRSDSTFFRDGTDPTKQMVFSLVNLLSPQSISVLVPNTPNPVIVAADAGAANNFLTGISTLGVITKARPTFANLTATPTTLAGYGITDAQPLDTDLTTIAGLTATTDNFIVAVSSAWASRTPAQVRTTLGLVVGTNVEAPLTFQQSLSRATNTVNLLNDSTSPGNSMLYGTNASGIKGWYVQPGVGGAVTSLTGTSPVVVSPTTGAAVASLNVDVNFAFTSNQAITVLDAATSGQTQVMSLGHNSSGTPLANFGVNQLWRAQSDTTINRTQGDIATFWVNPADASRTSAFRVRTVLNAAFTNSMTLWGSGGVSFNNITDPGANNVNIPTGGQYRVNNVDIATLFQPADSELTALAAVASTTDNFIVGVANVWAARTPAQVRTTLGLVIGANVQAWDTDLDFWATKSQASDLGLTVAQTTTVSDASTSSTPTVLQMRHNTSATPISGFGTALLFQAQSDTTINRTLGQMTFIWTQPADGTRASRLSIQTVASGAFVNNLYLFSSGGAGIGSNADPGANCMNLASGGVYKTNNTQIATNDLAASATNDTPAAGKIGQTVVSAIASASAVTYTTAQQKDLTSISLTAGDWDVRGILSFNVATLPSSSVYAATANIGTTTATIADDGEQSWAAATSGATTLSTVLTCPLPPRRISLASTTTVYLVGKAPTFASGSCGGFGYIEARRIR